MKLALPLQIPITWTIGNYMKQNLKIPTSIIATLIKHKLILYQTISILLKEADLLPTNVDHLITLIIIERGDHPAHQKDQ